MTGDASATDLGAVAPAPREQAVRPSRFHRLVSHPSATAAVALTLALPALYYVLRTAWFAAHEPFGRDQGIFQYVAYALSRGQRDYVDLHDMNGPLVHAIHLALYAMGGDDELRIRVIDTVVSGLVFFGVGMAIPGLGRRAGSTPPPTPVRLATRAAWGLAAFVGLFAHYFLYKWWDRTQRESFYLLFFLASLSFQLLAHIPGAASERRRRWLLGAAGALSILPFFGKPTCLFFTGAQVAGLLLDDEMPLRRRARVSAFAAGAMVGSLPMLAWTWVYADPRAMVSVILDDARLYRHIWHKSIAESYVAWGNAPLLNYGLATAGALVPLMALKVVPRRVWPAAFFLFAALAVFVVQGKGFPYHVQAITCASHLVWLMMLAVFAERGVSAAGRVSARALFPLAAAAAAFLSWHFVQDVTLCETMREKSRWYADSVTPEGRRERLPRDFVYRDFSPWDLRRAGWFIKGVTDPTDRVQTYAMDPYVLFFAERLSATPFLYNFEIDVDAALAGGSGGAPSEAERSWIREWGARNSASMTQLVMAHPPAAFVLIDDQPFAYAQDADADFHVHCPRAYEWMIANYARVRRFGAVRVWLRNDLLGRVPALQPGDDGSAG
jgi:hypothetical protein